MNPNSLKYLLLLSAFSPLSYADSSDLEKIYKLSNQVNDAVTHSDQYPKDGHFFLSKQEADIVKGVAEVDIGISQFTVAGPKAKTREEDCYDKDMAAARLAVEDTFNKRKYSIAAISTFNQGKYDEIVRKQYDNSSYTTYMQARGFNIGNGNLNFQKILTRPDIKSENDPKKKLALIESYLEKETMSKIPTGIIAAEFLYYDLLANPTGWKKSLTTLADKMNFDEKIRLVAKFGRRFGNDYNYQRADNDEGGIVPIEEMLKNLSTKDAGGVCRDVSLAQTKMLAALGVNQAYSVAYVSNSGGHATVIAVDPDDKNKIYKFNYGQLYEDNGKNGSAALDQNSTLPNVGTLYRIYDSEGQPLTSVPTGVGSILKNATNSNDVSLEAGKNYSVNKVSFSAPVGTGTIFHGTTSTGETISGIAMNASINDNNIEASYGAAYYKGKADKMYHDIDLKGLYMTGDLALKTNVYKTKAGEFSAGIGASTEIAWVKADGINKETQGTTEVSTLDTTHGFYSKVNYGLELNDEERLDLQVKAKARDDKHNVADESSRGYFYDSTQINAKYGIEYSEDIRLTTLLVNNIGRDGGNVYTKTQLDTPYGSGFITGNVATNKETPKFFEGQGTAAGIGYQTPDSSSWRFKIEYKRDFDNDSNNINATIEKIF